jgi:hypothetical protein
MCACAAGLVDVLRALMCMSRESAFPKHDIAMAYLYPAGVMQFVGCTVLISGS